MAEGDNRRGNATGDGRDTGGDNKECRSKKRMVEGVEVEETHGGGTRRLGR
jgi:hypothetical protein